MIQLKNVIGICCQKEMDCTVKEFSNGTFHRWGKCPICGKTGAKAAPEADLQSIKFKIQNLENRILTIKSQIDFEEAVAMMERSAKHLMGKRGLASW